MTCDYIGATIFKLLLFGKSLVASFSLGTN